MLRTTFIGKIFRFDSKSLEGEAMLVSCLKMCCCVKNVLQIGARFWREMRKQAFEKYSEVSLQESY